MSVVGGYRESTLLLPLLLLLDGTLRCKLAHRLFEGSSSVVGAALGALGSPTPSDRLTCVTKGYLTALTQHRLSGLSEVIKKSRFYHGDGDEPLPFTNGNCSRNGKKYSKVPKLSNAHEN